MKPRTKLQHEVWDLHKHIPLPKEHQPLMISKHKFYYTTHYKSLVCMECNHVWKPNKVWHEEVSGVKCTKCNKKLKKIETRNGGMAARCFVYSDVKVVDRFQVVRYFSCWKHMSKNKLPKYTFHSLFEEWKDWEKNKNVIVGRLQSYSGDGFASSDYEIRGYGLPRWQSNPYDRIETDYNCPGAELLPRFKKFGLTRFNHDIDYRLLIKHVNKSSQLETLFKAKQFSLVSHYLHDSSKVYRHWPSIKIAMRNKYKVKDAGIWLDYLDLLSYFNRDLRNSKYVCTTKLKKEHDRLMVKKQEIQRKEDIERKRLRVEKAQKDFQSKIQKFLGIQFSDGEITIKVLETVEEFMKEGDELKHCLFANDYHAKKDSLIFSARIDSRPIETIELSLKTMKVVQSRGFRNTATDHHDRIVDLMYQNIGKIESIVKPKKRNYAKAI